MADAFRVIHASTPTGTGTQSYTSTGFGTPIGAIVLTGTTDSEDTLKNNHRTSIGFSDLTFDRSFGLTLQYDAIPSNCKRQANTKIVHTRQTSDGSNLHIAAVDSTTTDGIVLDWTTTSATAQDILVVLIGSDAASSLYVNEFSPTVADTATDVTDPGFQADWIIAGWVDRSVPANGTDGTLAMGIAAYNGTSWDQWSFGVFSNHNADPSDCHSGVQEDCIIAAVDGGGEVGEVKITATNANGFTATPTATGYTTDVIYMCGKNPTGRQCQVSGLTAPTATGTWTNTDFSFEGDSMVLLGQRLTSYSYNTTSSSNNWRCHVAFAGADGSEGSLHMSSKNAHASNHKNRTAQGSTFLNTFNQNEAQEYDIDTVAFTTSGWTATVNTASPSTGPKWGALVFGAAATTHHRRKVGGPPLATKVGRF